MKTRVALQGWLNFSRAEAQRREGGRGEKVEVEAEGRYPGSGFGYAQFEPQIAMGRNTALPTPLSRLSYTHDRPESFR